MDILPGDLADPRIQALLRTHLTHARAESPPCSVHALDLAALQRPDVTFWAAWEGETLMGVGALKELAPDHGEVKSMHTAAAARGRGVGGAMLRHIVSTARARGYSRLSLETGSMEYFAPARALYRKHGFEACAPFGSYVLDPHSVFMTRTLTSMHDILFDIPLKRIDGAPASLAAHRGKVLLLVNVASKCGLTPQYAGLEALYREKRAQGLEVLGFPANNFLGQEPGTEEEIAAFCSTAYEVSFPLFSKISVRGEDAHPLYRELTQLVPEATGEGPMRQRLQGYGIATSAPGEVLWNFEKFLVGRSGKVVGRFAPDVAADDARLREAIERELRAPA